MRNTEDRRQKTRDRRHTARIASLAILLTVWTPLQAQQRPQYEPPTERNMQSERSRGFTRLWKVSVALLAASSVVDVHSSWGRLEANPVLRGPNGRFGMQGVVLKTMIASGVLGAQYLILRNHPKAAKYGAVTNMVMAGVITAAAMSNYHRNAGVPRGGAVVPKPASVQPVSFETPVRPVSPF
ncbi:MAG: hypothetical protein JNL98_33125 [Bryobacterales bacterium]|nr:hypothetical protein [Bryobacterales bacterium]